MSSHPNQCITALAVVKPGLAVSGDLFGGVCSWERGRADAVAYRKATARSSDRAIGAIAVTGGHVVVRDGTAGFAVLDAKTLKVKKKLPHKGSQTAVSVDGIVVTSGGKLLQAFRQGTWEPVAVREDLKTPTEAVAAVPEAKAVSFRDERGSAGLFATDGLQTIATRAFAAVPLRYDVEVDPTGQFVAVEVGDHTGKSRVKVWARSSVDVVTVDGEVGMPRFVGGTLAVASSTQTTEVPGGRWVSLLSLAPGELGRKIRDIDTLALGCGEWVKLAAARDNTLVLIGSEAVVVCDLEGTVRTRIARPRPIAAVFDGTDLVISQDDGRVTWLPTGAPP